MYFIMFQHIIIHNINFILCQLCENNINIYSNYLLNVFIDYN